MDPTRAVLYLGKQPGTARTLAEVNAAFASIGKGERAALSKADLAKLKIYAEQGLEFKFALIDPIPQEAKLSKEKPKNIYSTQMRLEEFRHSFLATDMANVFTIPDQFAYDENTMMYVPTANAGPRDLFVHYCCIDLDTVKHASKWMSTYGDQVSGVFNLLLQLIGVYLPRRETGVASSFIVESLSMLWLFSFVPLIQKEMMMVGRCLSLVFVLPTIWMGLLGASIGAMALEVNISATVPLVEFLLRLYLIQGWISKVWAWSSVPMKSSTHCRQFPRRGKKKRFKCGHWFGRRQRSTSISKRILLYFSLWLEKMSPKF
jgi:hypothetical protein